MDFLRVLHKLFQSSIIIDCNDGDFGIFQVTTPDKTDVYCKQLKYDNQGRKYLHSVSERADDPEFIESDETILQCIGKIITN